MNELEVILTDIFKCSRSDLYLNSASVVFTDKEFSRLGKILKNRGRTHPIQYILGYAEFMGMRFKVNKDVLIPRPETEILVEAVIEEISNIKYQKSKINILDIGTGSGCIAISLAKTLQNVRITATDISKEAINLAKENAKLHRVEKDIRFLQSDLFAPLEKTNDRVSNSLTGFDNRFFKTDIKFDIVVSNPPYVPTALIGIFDETTLKEPKMALDGGKDGLDFYRRIEKEAKRFLKKEGLLILELGDNQADNIRKIFSGKWVIEEFRKDYQGIERVCQMKPIRHRTLADDG